MSGAPRGFSREPAPPWLSLGACTSCTFCSRHPAFPPPDIPTALNALFRQRAHASLLRHRWGSMTPGCGMLTASPSALPWRAGVRPRLTPGRLALPGNPWSFGDGVSRPIYRYSYLHLLFHHLQHPSRDTFAGGGMLPYRCITRYIPRLRHRAYARLLSMRGRSTSELLRTLQMNGCFQANILAVCAAPPRYCLQLSPDFGALDGGLSCSSLGRGP